VGRGTKRNRTFNIAFTCGAAAGLSVRQLAHDLHVHLLASARECTVPLSRAQHPISRGTRVVRSGVRMRACARAYTFERPSRCLAMLSRIRVAIDADAGSMLLHRIVAAHNAPWVSWKAPFAPKGRSNRIGSGTCCAREHVMIISPSMRPLMK